MRRETIISPISIDLGAKTTGVYIADYAAGETPENISREGIIYHLEKDDYTLMMPNRTARRHQRRGYKRRQLAKRLFRLIWTKEFGLQWDQDTQRTISFLLNRRGFSFLTEEYDIELLKQFPKEAIQHLPDKITKQFDENCAVNSIYDLSDKFNEWTQNADQVSNVWETIDEQIKQVKSKLFVIARSKKLVEYCEKGLANEPISESKNQRVKLAMLPEWVLHEWIKSGIRGLNTASVQNKQANIVSFLNEEGVNFEQIRNSVPDTQAEEKNLKNSVWNFTVESFSLEKVDFDQIDLQDLQGVKVHLQHFAFAVNSIYKEFNAGARYRSKYFDEIKAALTDSESTHGYLNAFRKKLHNGEMQPRNSSPLNADRLVNLIGNLSNLELKPLRKYFNNPAHRKNDIWDADQLTNIFSNWILREWRVDFSKDKDKAQDERGDYSKLRSDWTKCRNSQGNVVEFWLNTHPNYSIPPYQNNNNRHPPRCQSLILNADFLDRNYPQWQEWLEILKDSPTVKDYLGNFECQLNELRSGRNRSYFTDAGSSSRKVKSGIRSTKHRDARVFQLILDRSKQLDPLNLNEIFSYVKKLRQHQSEPEEITQAKSELEETISKSQLPDLLKTIRHYEDDAVFKQSTFLHLICKYYRLRQRARAGRIFIHPEYRFDKKRGYERTGRYESKGHLLSYCNHKPRRKRYQIFDDVASALNVYPELLGELVGSKEEIALVSWLKSFSGLQSNCAKAAKEQKRHRGRLKIDFQNTSQHNNGLANLANRAKDLYRQLGERIYENDSGGYNRWVERANNNPAITFYLLIQLNNLAFTDNRHGYARTCAVCSRENSYRMQTTDGNVNAQRLPAISTRLIDGAVMRMARIVCRAIASDKWKQVEKHLNRGSAVRIPIITESNRFEFEPELEELKNRAPTDSDARTDDKRDRIVSASQGVSPYSGDRLDDDGEIDHIIPRSHNYWGTLNDEANLIYTSRQDNHAKDKSEYSLANLSDVYKQMQFNCNDDDDICDWITEQIWDDDTQRFKFGKYSNFRNLSLDQRKAFRHALFLVGNDLREQVIQAINHRTKTIVNGTQRYFAEVLANELYKKAKKSNRSHLISFDYFGVEASSNSRGDGISDLRRELVEYHKSELKEFKKEENVKQKPYSHLIDAQIAFCMFADAHRNEGSVRLELTNKGIWSRSNQEANGLHREGSPVYGPELFNAIQVSPQNAVDRKLVRRFPRDDYFDHRSMHRDTMYAEHYLLILIKKSGDIAEVRVGFDWINSFQLNDTKPNRKKLYFALQFSEVHQQTEHLSENDSFDALRQAIAQYRVKSRLSYFYVSLNTRKIHEFFVENFHMNKPPEAFSSEVKFLRKIAYRTERKKIENLNQTEQILNNKTNFKINSKIRLPVEKEWKRIVKKWKVAIENNSNLDNDEFLRKYFKEAKKSHPHERVHNVYSLPTKTDGGMFLIRRRSWCGDSIFQIVNDSDSNLKPFVPVLNKNSRRINPLLINSFKSSNVFRLKDDRNYEFEENEDIHRFSRDEWFTVELDKDIKNLGISHLAFRVDNVTRPKVQIRLSKKPTQTEIKQILNHSLLKPRSVTKLKQDLDSSEPGQVIDYQGSGLIRQIENKLVDVLLD